MDCPPERMGECKAAASNSGFFFAWFMKLILDLLGALRNFLVFPSPIFRCGVLRQGSDKFYSLSFQARLSLLVTFMTSGSPES
jgi:hypothetical protein